MAETFSNNASSSLNNTILANASSLTVANATSFPDSPNFRIRIGNELLLVTGVAGGTFTVTRGIEGTTATSHLAGANVSHVLTAGSLAQIVHELTTTPDFATYDGKLALNGSVGDLPEEGTVRIAGGTLSEGYTPGFDIRMRGLRPDGITPADIGLLFGYSADFGSQGVLNEVGIGDWFYDPEKSPDFFRILFNRVIDFAYTQPTPQGDYLGAGMESWAYDGSPPIEDWPHRRAFFIQRHTNFAIFGQRDHLADAEEGLGNGEGVFYFGWAEVAPSTNPTEGIILFVDSTDNLLKYRRPDGTVITVDNWGSTANTSHAQTFTELDTSDDTPTTIGSTFEIPNNSILTVDVRVACIQSGASNAKVFDIRRSFLNDGGTVTAGTQHDLVEPDEFGSLAASVAITNTDSTGRIEITGVDATALRWRVDRQTIRVTSAP